MKLPALLLVGSLAANALLLTWWLAPDRTARAPSAANPSAVASTTAAPSAASPASLATLAPAALRAHLVSLALPPEAIAALVRARIYARHDARRRELLTAAAQNAPWWKAAHRTGPGDPLRLLTPAQRKELSDLDAEARAATLAELGPAALDPEGKIAARYAFLTPEKAVLLDALERDYQNLNAELRDEIGLIRTAADREREKLLETERQRDLAALLTPAERDALDQRTSPTATRLSSRMLALQATDDEFRAIYALQKAFDEEFPAAYSPHATATDRPTPDARREFDQKLKAALGDTRFADWETSLQIHATALARLALVNNLPAQTVRDVTTLLSETANSSWRIAEDKAFTSEQRGLALAKLAADTRAQVSARLGPDTATAYLRDVFWIDTIANGGAIRFSGGGFILRTTGAKPPAKAPTAPTPPRT